MKKIALVVAVFSAFAGSAQADTFHYSYVFDSGNTITGSFDGTASGDLVTGLSNITAVLDGVAFIGPLFGSSMVSNSGWQSGGAVASFTGNQNNFLFVDADYPTNTSITNYFFIADYYSNQSLVTTAHSWTTGAQGYDSNGWSAARWTLTNVSAVPEPETYAMLLAGLGVMGTVARRRKAKQA